jgi:hypothetical protein
MNVRTSIVRDISQRMANAYLTEYESVFAICTMQSSNEEDGQGLRR